jgi:hypothetical protein
MTGTSLVKGQLFIAVGFDHPNYGHMATMPEPVRAALAEDFA